jgi:TolB-like protein/class 3 adenylate cyclase
MEAVAPARVERRLAAILAADVAGYSRLIGADEEGTLSRLKALRAEVIDPKIAEHHGRIVKTTGDGLLVEFASVVDALRCAAEIQAAVAESNASLTADKRIDLRIGINMGDIVVEDGDIFGDGVNVAARLEGLAEPGGICVSARVREDAAGKLDLAFRDLGEQQLRNIARPVHAYAVGAATLPARSRRRRIGRSGLVAAAAILAVVAIGTAALWAWPHFSAPATTTAQAPPTTTPPAGSVDAKPAPRLSIVVLPFANLSNDPEQQYFADGITDDLTTDLSRLRNVLVISRSTAFTYKAKDVDAKQIGRELGVRYVLEGSVRRSGNQVRVNAQLIDAASNTHLWAERFDHDIGDLFAIQNEITGRIANTLNFELVAAETARPAERSDALDYFLRGRAALDIGGGDKFEKAVDLLEHALALDLRSVVTQTRLANALLNRAQLKDPEAAAADLRRVDELLAQALAASPGDPYAHRIKGNLLRFERRCEEAIPEFEIALAADRNNPFALANLSVCKYLTGGSDQEAIALTEQAIRLSPHDPNMYWWYTWIGFVHLLQSRIDEAIAWLEKGRSVQPKAPQPHWFLAATYGFKGELERARAELAEAIKLTGSDRYSTIARSRANGDLYTPALRDRWETVYFPGMRAAGLPEE